MISKIPRWQPSKNYNISKTVGQILAEFGVMMHNNLPTIRAIESSEISNKTTNTCID